MAIRLYQASCAIRMPIFWQQQFLFHVMGIFTQACLDYWYSEHLSISSLVTTSCFCCNDSFCARTHASIQLFKPCRCSHLWFSLAACPRQVWGPSYSLPFRLSSAFLRVLGMIPATSHDVWACKLTLDSCLGWLSDQNLLQCDLWPTHYALSQHTIGQHDWSPDHSVERQLPYKHIP